MLYLAFIIGLFCVFLNEKSGKVNKTYFYVFILSLFFIAIMRFGIGADYFAYDYLYNIMSSSDINNSFFVLDNVEWLFKYIMMSFNLLGISYHLFNVFFTVIILGFTLYWISKKSPNKYLSILLYISMFFLVWTLSAIRQGLVIAILLNVFFGEKKFSTRNQILISVGLSLIHSSAIIALLIYLISKLNFNKKTILYFFIVSIVFNLFSITSNLAFLENVPYISKLLFYIDPVKISIFSFTSLMRLSFFFIVWFYYDQLVERYEDKTFINFVLINYILFFFLLFSVITSSRISIFGHLSMVVILPMILELYSKSKQRNIVLSSLILFSVFSFVKELDTVIDQTGFEGTKTELNFVSILNPDRTLFDQSHALESAVDKSFKLSEAEFDKEKYIVEKNQKVVPYNPDLNHISVYFPIEKLYGIINENGEIVELPLSFVRTQIFDDAVEVVYNPYDFKTVLYREMQTGKSYTYHQTLDIVEKGNDEITRFNAFWYDKKKVDFTLFQQKEYMNQFNLGPINEAEKISSEFHPGFSYLKMTSNVRNYLVLLDENDEVLVNHIYYKIDAFNEKNIAVGHTKTQRHYINKKGEIIWVEDK